MRWLKNAWSQNKSLIIFVSLMLVFRSAIADWNDVPTGSMKPTIVEGDRIIVNKMAYDIRIPFTQVSLTKLADPKVNDIIIFESKAADQRLVKRVIGVPGDKIAMIDNQLIINGKKADYQISLQDDNSIEANEIAGDFHRKIKINRHFNPLDSFDTVTVPAEHYLVLGDNRDNSADSRVIGFVPREEIIGNTNTVAFSLNYDNYLIPRSERFFKSL